MSLELAKLQADATEIRFATADNGRLAKQLKFAAPEELPSARTIRAVSGLEPAMSAETDGADAQFQNKFISS